MRIEPDAKIVQLDVLVVLRAHFAKISRTRVIESPDLFVEVASPGTAIYDQHSKYEAYARAGIPEYWIADPASQTVEVLLLEEQSYVSQGVFSSQATLPSTIVPNIAEVRIEQFFASDE